MPFFSRVFKGKDGGSVKSGRGAAAMAAAAAASSKPLWEDGWTRPDVAPEEIQELIRVCTQEMKSRVLDMPFLLLPYRPNTEPVDCRIFIRNYFKAQNDRSDQYSGQNLHRELTLTEPLVLCSIMKWCWSRLSGGVVTWEAYELFRIGEKDSKMAMHAFDTLIPLSVESDARKQIIFHFFELLAAIAARGKANGLGGRKLSRLAGWWAFSHSDDSKGFEGGYNSWAKAADAASHLFFAYLRSNSPDALGVTGINTLPRSLQSLLSQTEYPPGQPMLMQTTTTKVVMIVGQVSPTPFALLRRAKNFEYPENDEVLVRFSSFEDPVQALTDECRRVLKCISSANQSGGNPTMIRSMETKTESNDPTWSRFEDMGFASLSNGHAQDGEMAGGDQQQSIFGGMRSAAASRANESGRPTTPSWADFLSSGFHDDRPRQPSLLPPDKALPPLSSSRAPSAITSFSRDEELEDVELASIARLDLDDTFWWVWMTSLAVEEPLARKAVFGRCALIETKISGARWLVLEEQVKGASPGQDEAAYVVPKKKLFSFGRRGRQGRRKSMSKKQPEAIFPPYALGDTTHPHSTTSISTDQQAKIHAAATALARHEKEQQDQANFPDRRARREDDTSRKTNSMLSLQPVLVREAVPAMKWARHYDRDKVRAKYLGDRNTGKGLTPSDGIEPVDEVTSSNADVMHSLDRDLPSVPEQRADGQQSWQSEVPIEPEHEREQRSAQEQNESFPSTRHPESRAPNTPAPAYTPPRRQLTADSLHSPEAAADVFGEKPSLTPQSIGQHPAYRTQQPESAGVPNQGASLSSSMTPVSPLNAAGPGPAASSPSASSLSAAAARSAWLAKQQPPPAPADPVQQRRLNRQPTDPQQQSQALRQSGEQPPKTPDSVGRKSQDKTQASPKRLQKAPPPQNRKLRQLFSRGQGRSRTKPDAAAPTTVPDGEGMSAAQAGNVDDEFAEHGEAEDAEIEAEDDGRPVARQEPSPFGSAAASRARLAANANSITAAHAQANGASTGTPTEVVEKEHSLPTANPYADTASPLTRQAVPASERTNFNQGPLEEMPAYVPQERVADEEVHRRQHKNEGPADEAPAPAYDEVVRSPQQHTIMNDSPAAAAAAAVNAAHSRTAVDTSKVTSPISRNDEADSEKQRPKLASTGSSQASLPATPVEDPQDRWAQIRKNAAQRAAKTDNIPSANTTRPARAVRTASGATPATGATAASEEGEESIETRVARIKARVAELTGNVDGKGSAIPTK